MELTTFPRIAPFVMHRRDMSPPRALDKRDRLSPLESSQAAAVGTGDLAGPGVRHVAPAKTPYPHPELSTNRLEIVDTRVRLFRDAGAEQHSTSGHR